MIPVRASVRGESTPVLSWLIIAANVLMFLFEAQLPEETLDQVITAWGVVPARELHDLVSTHPHFDGWPILASMFMHSGLAHLGGNMMYLYVFGRSLESRLGSLRFLLVYFLGGLAASQAQVLFSPQSAIPMIGASGAIAAVLGAYLLAYPRSAVTVLVPVFFWPLFFDVPALLFLGIWFFEQLFAGAALALSPAAAAAGGVAWWAHIGGFIAGALMIATFRKRARAHPAPPYNYQGARIQRGSWVAR